MIKKKSIESLIKCYNDFTCIFEANDCKKMMENCGIELDIDMNMLKLNEKSVIIPSQYGLHDKKGYGFGHLIMGINALLNDKEMPTMVCSFPSSIYYALEVIETTKKAVKEIQEFLITNKGDNE